MSTGTTSNLMSDNIVEFLQKKVNSFIKWDLIRFFHDNPHTKDTSENLAQYIGRDARTIERELMALVKTRVLAVEEISGLRVYALAQDEAVRETINQFMEACHDREFRVEAINRVIQQMQFSPRHDF